MSFASVVDGFWTGMERVVGMWKSSGWAVDGMWKSCGRVVEKCGKCECSYTFLSLIFSDKEMHI